MDQIEAALKEASAPAFWGEIGITYRSGKPVVVRITKTLSVNSKETPAYGNSTSPYSQAR
jgi:hypothetical protein